MSKPVQATEIELGKLVVSKFNVRKSVGDISDLVDSIGLKGVLQPIVVRPSGSRYEVVIGSRRLAAAKKCGLDTIPAIVREMDDREALIESLTENLQRNTLEPSDLGQAVYLLRSTFAMTQKEVAKHLGLGQSRISEIETVYQLLIKLEKSGRRVEFYPKKEDREKGQAVPFEHTYMVATAFDNPEVKEALGKLPETKVDQKKVELVEAIAPLREDQAKKVVDEFKMYPGKPIEEIKKRALVEETGVSLETYLRPSVARKLREIAQDERKPFAEMATELLERSLETADLTGTNVGAKDVEGRHYERVEMPEEPIPVQFHNKLMWNIERLNGDYDFFTIGYSQVPDVEGLIQRLKGAGARTLVDIRHDPVSQYRPEFSKENLGNALKGAKLNYVHIADLGVPREERAKVTQLEGFNNLWKWYDRNVVQRMDDIFEEKELRGYEKPLAFMCVELDPTKCHRHRLALGLEKKGMKGFDL